MTRRGDFIYGEDPFDYGRSSRSERRNANAELQRKIGEYTVEEVIELHQTVLKQNELLERLTKAGIEYSRVIDFDDGNPVISGGRGGVRVEPPDFTVHLGDWVICSQDTKQITGASYRNYVGEVVTISRVVDENRVEVGGLMGSRLLLRQPDEECDAGEEWLADSTIGCLIEKIERPRAQEQNDYSPVYWSEIGGLELVKRELQEAIALIRHEDRNHSDFYSVKQPKGCLLYGPPGNGKTMLARAVATELAGDTTQFTYIKGPEILSKFVGMSEERIKNLFLKARRAYVETGRTSVIAIDECDAIMNARGSGRSSDVERTIVPAFLTEMDGLETSHAFIMLLTNRPDILDPAIIREGRIDKHIEISAPDRDAVKAIFMIHLGSLPCQMFYEELAEAATDIVFHAGVSGALCAAVIERAKRIALRRDIEAQNYSGICMEDVREAARGAMEKVT